MSSFQARRVALRRFAKGSTPGFAAVDALVALTMLSSTLILAMGAAVSAQRAAAASLEARQAHVLLEHLMTTPREQTGVWSGVERALKWRLVLAPATDPALSSAWRLCRRTAEVLGVSSGRRYRVVAAEPCALEDEA